MEDPNLNELTTFVEVMRQGSLAGAAKSLGVPKSTVGRRITRLEERLEVVLFKRDGGRAAATNEARALFDRTCSPIDSLNAALRASREGYSQPAGVIRVTAPSDVGRLCVARSLAAFSRAHPRIRFDLQLTDRMVDLLTEGFDLAVRAGASPEDAAAQSLVSRKVGEIWVCMAGTLQLAQSVRSPRDLERLPWILFRPSGRNPKVRLVKSGRERIVEVRGRHVVQSYSAMAALIREGEGVGILPEMHVNAGGEGLVRVLPEYRWRWADLSVLYPSRTLPARVALLVEHLSDTMGALLEGPMGPSASEAQRNLSGPWMG